MSGFVNKVKEKTSSSSSKSTPEEEQKFTIQPHPAKSNDPADVVNQDPQPGGGLNSDANIGALKATGPFVPDEEMKANMEQPKSRAELRARGDELNR